jgi:WD40 repeat protein
MRPVWMVLVAALVPAATAGEPAPHLKLLATLEGAHPKEGATAPIAFSPDGKLLAVGDYKAARLDRDGKDHPGHSLVQLWDVDKRKVIATLRGHTDAVCGVVFSRDGKTLVSVTDGGREVKLWDVATGGEKPPLQRDARRVFLGLSPDGKTVAFANDDNHGVMLWDTSTGKEKVSTGGAKVSLKGYSSLIGPVAISPDGTLWAAGGGRYGSEGLPGAGEVKVWDVATGRERATLKGEVKLKVTPRSLSYLKAEGVPKRVLLKLAALNGMEFPTEEDVDGQLTKALEKILDKDQREKYLKLVLGQIGTTYHEGPEVVRSIAFSPDGKTLASGSVYGSVLLWDVKSGKRAATFQRFNPYGRGGPNPAYSVAFSPDGKILAAGTLLGIKLWDVESGQNVVALSDPPGTVWSVAFSPDGKTVATAGSKEIIGPRDQFEPDPTVRLWEWIPARKAGR